MKRRFIQVEEKFPTIKRKHIIFSIVVGLFYSFVFYSFLYLSREAVRLLSVTDKYDIMILSDKEVSFYNLFFAFLSLIFAQSIGILLWFGKTRKAFEKRNIYKSAIINDQLFLNTYFLSWFSRLATVYALFMLWLPFGGFYVFSFYPKYNYIFILFLIVLFLQTWVTIRRVYKRKALKLMLFSAVIISVLAFALSRINLVDYQKINQICLEKNIAHKYKLELAEVETFEYSFNIINDIYLVKPSDTMVSKNPIIIFNGKELSFNDLEQDISQHTKSMEGYIIFEYSFFGFRVHIDKSIKMSFVNRLKDIMINADIHRVDYAVIPLKREYDKRYYTYCSSAWRLINKEEYENTELKDFDLLSVSYVADSLQINNIACSSKDFYSKIKQQIEEHENYLLLFTVDNEMIFADYIFVLSEFRKAIAAIRNEYAMKHYSLEFENLSFEADSIIRNKIPLRLMEIDREK